MSLISKSATSHYIVKWETEYTKRNPNGEIVAYYWNGNRWDKNSAKYFSSLQEAVNKCNVLGQGCVMDVFE